MPAPRPAPFAEVSLEYPGSSAQAAGNVTSLWRADLADQGALVQGRIEPGAWTDASLRWLVDPVALPEADLPGGVRVGLGDVERFRVTVETFKQLDDRFGGGHARPALIQYLSSDGDRLLRGRYTEAVGSALFSSVAEATLLAAWMSYDAAPRSALAQRYFIQALALAHAGRDRLLGAGILDAMSHQATYTGRFTEAASLASGRRKEGYRQTCPWTTISSSAVRPKSANAVAPPTRHRRRLTLWRARGPCPRRRAGRPEPARRNRQAIAARQARGRHPAVRLRVRRPDDRRTPGRWVPRSRRRCRPGQHAADRGDRGGARPASRPQTCTQHHPRKERSAMDDDEYRRAVDAHWDAVHRAHQA